MFLRENKKSAWAKVLDIKTLRTSMTQSSISKMFTKKKKDKDDDDNDDDKAKAPDQRL